CQAEDGIRGRTVTGVQTCALPIFIVTVRSGAGSPTRTSWNDAGLGIDRFVITPTQVRSTFAGGSAVTGSNVTVIFAAPTGPPARSEERRVGKEGRSQ